MRTLKVSEVAAEAEVSAHTLRFYENEGLLRPPARSPSGYRQYDESALERIRFIKTGKALGLSCRTSRS